MKATLSPERELRDGSVLIAEWGTPGADPRRLPLADATDTANTVDWAAQRKLLGFQPR
jgi:hypothetical protein